MGDLQELFGVDETKEIEGVWQDAGDGVQVRVARINNPNYKKVLDKLLLPYKRQMRKGSLKDDIIENLITKAIAKTILLDWKNLKVNGKVVAFSPEKAEELLFQFKDFRDLVSDIASEMEIYKAEEDAEAEKN